MQLEVYVETVPVRVPLENLCYLKLNNIFCNNWKLNNPHWESPESGYLAAVEKFDVLYTMFINYTFEIPLEELFVYVNSFDC